MTNTMFVSDLELKPGMSGAEVERFFVEEFLPNVSELPGFKVTLHVGDNGKRPGKYLMVNYFESLERAQQLFSGKQDAAGQWGVSDEFTQWEAANPVFQKLMSYFDYEKMMNEFTQYDEIR